MSSASTLLAHSLVRFPTRKASSPWTSLHTLVDAGVEPRYMGIAPVAAIPKVLSLTGLAKEDIDVWEVCQTLIISAMAFVLIVVI